MRELAREISATLDATVADPALAARTLTDAALIEQIDTRVMELPAEVRHAMRLPATATGAAIVSRLPLADNEFGPTPSSPQEAAQWSGDPARRAHSLEFDIVMLLLARSAGEPFGWEGHQDGRLVNNILPVAGHEHEQSGVSSRAQLSPHTEDAFHPRRAHLLMLGCIRNPDLVGTTVSSARYVELSAVQRELLSTPALPILPDVSYGEEYDRHSAVLIPTLWTATGPDEQTMRFDPAYTPLKNADPEFRAAYERLAEELERVRVTAVLAPGEVLLVDNDVAVHGRVPFTARYDGTDRWLKLVNVWLPQRSRRVEEADESGYGERIVAPFRSVSASMVERRTDDRLMAPNDRGILEQP
ncbi:TauD/TfdA family dioxygenase [Nocardia sp. NPDC047038]|uniref:TauD/TfdA family dioxygenase n=1 Tax=Nocardia sp. NPDC047038 TaxID=3154338 RepID=UPI0033F7B5E4